MSMCWRWREPWSPPPSCYNHRRDHYLRSEFRARACDLSTPLISAAIAARQSSSSAPRVSTSRRWMSAPIRASHRDGATRRRTTHRAADLHRWCAVGGYRRARRARARGQARLLLANRTRRRCRAMRRQRDMTESDVPCGLVQLSPGAMSSPISRWPSDDPRRGKRRRDLRADAGEHRHHGARARASARGGSRPRRRARRLRGSDRSPPSLASWLHIGSLAMKLEPDARRQPLLSDRPRRGDRRALRQAASVRCRSRGRRELSGVATFPSGDKAVVADLPVRAPGLEHLLRSPLSRSVSGARHGRRRVHRRSVGLHQADRRSALGRAVPRARDRDRRLCAGGGARGHA